MKALLIAIALGSSAAFAQWDTQVNQILDFAEQFRAIYGNELHGKTLDGKACVFSVWDKSWKGDSSCGYIDNRAAYISLGTSSDETNAPGNQTYIGSSINPDCTLVGHYEIKKMEVSPDAIHFVILHDEVQKNGIEVDLLIKKNSKGQVSEVQGTSSYWPASTCLFEVK